MKYIIIGNSAAGIAAVEGIRQEDKSGEIIIITDEPHHTYSRPLISYFLMGKVSPENMKYRNSSFYCENNCSLLHASAKAIDAAKKHVVLLGGKKIEYDKLLIASGSSAFIPPYEGLEKVKNKFTFMNLDDAKKLDKALGKDKKVLIAGAGLIGLKCAEGSLNKAADITVINRSPGILTSILDVAGAGIVQEHLKGKGIHFKCAVKIERFEKNTAFLDNGDSVIFDVLVLAVGARPNTALLNGIAKIDKGIVINEKSETSVKDIYAAGDCSQSCDISSGQSKIMPLLPNAYMQGECAGVNMAGGEKIFNTAMPMNAVSFCGLHIITAGNHEGTTYLREKDGNYKRLFYGNNKLNGYILIGDVEKAGIYTSLIREHTPLDSIDFSLICEKPGLMAFAKKDRIAKLGGAAL